jgi:hypothetical protein
MIINVSINDNLFILYFHSDLDAKFEQYREHYAQTHEIVSNESSLIKNINYAINRFLNIYVNRSISRKSTLVMIVIILVSNSFLTKFNQTHNQRLRTSSSSSSKCHENSRFSLVSFGTSFFLNLSKRKKKNETFRSIN